MTAPRKAQDGLGHVLFVRVDKDMVDKLDGLAERLRVARRQPGMSRSDLVRELLANALKQVGVR